MSTYTFKPQMLFTKGIAYAEFFDVNNSNLLGYSPYATDFGLNGSMNDGDVEGGIGNQLIISLPDTSRLAVTCKTADSALNNLALPIGQDLAGYGVIETMTAIVASGTSLSLANAVAPYGAENPVCYILTSSGSDKAEVEAASGVAHTVSSGTIQDFTAVNGNTYCVKYFVANSSADKLTIPALFQPKVVRAHFAVNVYAQNGSGDAMSGTLVKIRHYYFPRYQFNSPLQVTESQTTPGSTDLSGRCLSYQQALESGMCASENNAAYGFIVDEIVGSNTSTAKVEGIYFIGLGTSFQITNGETVTIPVKYAVNGVLTDISDMSKVTFTSSATAKASFADSHSNVLTAASTGDTVITCSVTNSVTGKTYSDTANVTVVAAA